MKNFWGKIIWKEQIVLSFPSKIWVKSHKIQLRFYLSDNVSKRNEYFSNLYLKFRICFILKKSDIKIRYQNVIISDIKIISLWIQCWDCEYHVENKNAKTTKNLFSRKLQTKKLSNFKQTNLWPLRFLNFKSNFWSFFVIKLVKSEETGLEEKFSCSWEIYELIYFC